MPDALTAVVEQAVTAWDQGEAEAAQAWLNQALVLAQELGYL
jgi:hypothetical protein